MCGRGEPGIGQLRHPGPCEPVFLAAPPQRAPPQVGHMVAEGHEGTTVGWHRMMGKVAADHLRQPAPLDGDRLMPPQHVLDPPERRPHAGPAELINGKAPGRRAILNETQRAALQAIVEQGPIPAIHGVVRWRWVDLIAWLWEEVCLSISQQTLSRELRAMNYRKLSARPRHEEVCLSISQQTLSRELRAMNYRKLSARPRHYAQNENAADIFNKRPPPAWRRSQRRSAASRSRFGSRTRRGLDKRTRSRGAGPSAARAPQPLTAR